MTSGGRSNFPILPCGPTAQQASPTQLTALYALLSALDQEFPGSSAVQLFPSSPEKSVPLVPTATSTGLSTVGGSLNLPTAKAERYPRGRVEERNQVFPPS